MQRERRSLDALLHGNGDEDAAALRMRMQEIMTEKVGIFRRGSDLEAAVDELRQLLQRSRRIHLRCRDEGANPELVAAYRVRRMLKLALTVAYGALMRTESRGAHYREDYPRRDDAAWLKRTLARWPEGDATLPELSYETIDVMGMELPPGWRGYGARDTIEHPDTARRAAQVAAIRERMNSADRWAVQQALMPYEHLLPEVLRGRNERVDERFLA
jgi:fumarate reductase flavoprotein subunit